MLKWDVGTGQSGQNVKPSQRQQVQIAVQIYAKSSFISH